MLWPRLSLSLIIASLALSLSSCGFFENSFDPKKALPNASKIVFPDENDSRVIGPEQIPEGLFQANLVRLYYEKKNAAALISHLISSQGSPQVSDSFQKDIAFGDSKEAIQSTLNLPLEIDSQGDHSHFRKRRYYWLQANQAQEITWPQENMYIDSTQGQSIVDNFNLGQRLNKATFNREYSGTKERSLFIRENEDKIVLYYEISAKESLELYEVTYVRGSYFKSSTISDEERIVLPSETDASVVDKNELPLGEYKIQRIRSHFFSQDYRLEGFFDHLTSELGQPSPTDTIEQVMDWGETRTINAIESHLNLPLQIHQSTLGQPFELLMKRHFWEKVEKTPSFTWSQDAMTEESLQGDHFVEVFDEGTKTGRGLYTRTSDDGSVARAMIQKVSDTEFKILFQQDATESKPFIATYELTYKVAP